MKLHLGCGKLYLKNYINIDIESEKADIKHDIIKLDFINNEKVDEIYICHVLEHIQRNDTLKLFLEWNRLLKKEGILRISVPNFESVVNVYQKNKNMSELLGLINGGQRNRFDIHFVCYDLHTLKEILEITGFYYIKIYDPFKFLSKDQDDYSKAYLPHLDFENGTCMSLNIVCKKEKNIDKTNIKITDNIKKFCKI
jgi:predicted SAM-dependent methyltransferase